MKLRFIQVLALFVLLAGTAHATHTKGCRLELDLVGKKLALAQVFADELNHFTDADRPVVDRALRNWINASREEMIETCKATTEKDALAAYDRTHTATSLALIRLLDVRREAKRN